MRRELDRVREQVGEDPLHRVRVAVDVARGGRLGAQLQAAGLGDGRPAAQDVVDEAAQIARPRPDVELLLPALREQQHVVDEPELPRGGSLNRSSARPIVGLPDVSFAERMMERRA